MSLLRKTTFKRWVRFGLKKGWIGPPVCISHDGMPISNDEFEDNDLCVILIRVYMSRAQRNQVEQSHLASITNVGDYT